MDVIEVVHKEVAMTQVAMRDPPLCLEPGYANEEGHARGMAAPEYGWFEVVNKTKQGGEIIARPPRQHCLKLPCIRYVLSENVQ